MTVNVVLFIAVLHMIFHELGHYLAALFFGWNPEIKVLTKWGIWSGLAIKTSMRLPESLDEVPSSVRKIMICGASGCVGVVPIILASFLMGNALWLWGAVPALLYNFVETIQGVHSFLIQSMEWLRR